jgi:DNA-binding NarL/FixJ family response regulator
MPVRQVLVVDDFLPWLRLVRAMLESKDDLNIIEALDGSEAVQKAQQFQPDLILLDISLPSLNGIESARRIRELSPNSKILFVSSESSAEVVEEALRVGARGYLWKPDAASELLLAVDAILRGEQFVGSRLRPDVITSGIIGPSPSKAQKSADVKTSRAMEWEISAQKATYTCTRCAWELVVEVGTCPEPFRLFEQHVCANHVLTSRVHEVASYRDEASFVDGLVRFIDAALKKGKSVIVITSEAYRGNIRRGLQARGWDVAAAIQEGIYISLDASDTLSTFMVDDWPDATRLFETAGNLISDAAKMAKSEPPRVAICGECAPILWAQGKAEAAIQLEKLWDAVARRHEVDILCGYMLAGLRRSENSHIFERICAEHSGVYSVSKRQSRDTP